MISQRRSRACIVVVGSLYVFGLKTFLRFRGLRGERPSAPIWAPPVQLAQPA